MPAMRQDTATTPPGQRQDTARTAVSVAEASTRLGITPDAVRKKLQRGTLAGEKQDGEWRVFLPEQDTQQDNRQDATETRQDTDRPLYETMLARQDAEIAFLREQLDHSRRELAAERERFDIIHREALQRIEALMPGETLTDSVRVSDDADLSPSAAPGSTQPLQGVEIPPVPESWIATALRKLRGRS